MPDRLHQEGTEWPQDAGTLAATSGLADPISWLSDRSIPLPPDIPDMIALSSTLVDLELAVAAGHPISKNFPFLLFGSYFFRRDLEHHEQGKVLGYLFSKGLWHDVEGDQLILDSETLQSVDSHLCFVDRAMLYQALSWNSPMYSTISWISRLLVERLELWESMEESLAEGALLGEKKRLCYQYVRYLKGERLREGEKVIAPPDL